MTWEQIMQIVLIGLVILSIIITTVGGIAKKVKAKKEKGEKVDLNFIITEVVKSLADAVKSNEEIFASFARGGNIKAGVLKLERVLGTCREVCERYGIVYDEETFKTLTNKLVDLINIGDVSKHLDTDKTKTLGGITHES